jgi:hypothetical protein
MDSLSNRTLAAATLANLAAMESRSSNRQLAILSEIASLMTSDRPMSTMEQTAAPPVPPTQPTLCGKCQGPIVNKFPFHDVDYCSWLCRHAAGDRSECRRGECGCTGFAIKRRQLRNQRQMMRAMQSVINENDLWEELDDELQDTFGLRSAALSVLETDSEMDEGSDTEDPMVAQANELSNIDSIVQMSRNMVELAEVRRDLKRTRGSD